MLTLCSFLRSFSQSLSAAFVNMTKRTSQNSSILIVGVLMMTAMTGISGLLGTGNRNALTVFAEVPIQHANETRLSREMELPAQAKKPFQLTNLTITEEGQKLVGETLAESVTLQQELFEQQQEIIDQNKAQIQLLRAEQEQAAAAAAIKAEQEAVHAGPVVPYTSQDYEVLTRIVQAESGGCDIKGRILIANVIFNRVKSDQFPDTITDVVYQKSQFSPVSDGSMKSCTVTDTTIEAVDRALAGEDYSDGALYFMNRSLSHSHNVSWFDRKLTYLFEYDRHEFFK